MSTVQRAGGEWLDRHAAIFGLTGKQVLSLFGIRPAVEIAATLEKATNISDRLIIAHRKKYPRH